MVKDVHDLSCQCSTRSSKAPCEKKFSTSWRLSLDDGPRSCLLVMSSKDTKLLVRNDPKSNYAEDFSQTFTLKASPLLVSVTMSSFSYFTNERLNVFTHLKSPERSAVLPNSELNSPSGKRGTLRAGLRLLILPGIDSNEY